MEDFGRSPTPHHCLHTVQGTISARFNITTPKKEMKIITILLNVTFFCVGPTESAERNEF